MASALLLIAGAAALVAVVRRTRPGVAGLCAGGAVAAAVTLCFVVARRQAALAAAIGVPGWARELLAGGASLPRSPYLGLERMPALALWALVSAGILYGDAMGDDERGPWWLALLPPLALAALLVLWPGGQERLGAGVALAVAVVAVVVSAIAGHRRGIRRR